VGNTASYGGGMPICPEARPDDGLLDVVHVAPLGRARLLALFPLLLRGRHLARQEVAHRRVREIAVSAPDLVVYADGERIAEKECTIRVRPGTLTVMVPRGGAA
jgi:diacylglycerol kinase (ATP)